MSPVFESSDPAPPQRNAWWAIPRGGVSDVMARDSFSLGGAFPLAWLDAVGATTGRRSSGSYGQPSCLTLQRQADRSSSTG